MSDYFYSISMILKREFPYGGWMMTLDVANEENT